MKEFLEDFTQYLLQERSASQSTRQAYRHDLEGLLAFLAERNIYTAEQVSPQELADYVLCLDGEGKSAATISRCVASIRAFFAYLEKRGLLVRSPGEALRPPKVVRRTPAVLTEEEAERLLNAPDLKTPKGLRDRAMLELLYATGLRVSELTGLRMADLNQRQRMLIIQGSGRMRVVPYGKRCSRYLLRYLRAGRPRLLCEGEPEALFLSCKGQAMSRQGFWKLIKRYGREAGIRTELTPHTMRHSFAVHALREGEDIRKVQTILGHSDVATTHGYISL